MNDCFFFMLIIFHSWVPILTLICILFGYINCYNKVLKYVHIIKLCSCILFAFPTVTSNYQRYIYTELKEKYSRQRRKVH